MKYYSRCVACGRAKRENPSPRCRDCWLDFYRAERRTNAQGARQTAQEGCRRKNNHKVVCNGGEVEK